MALSKDVASIQGVKANFSPYLLLSLHDIHDNFSIGQEAVRTYYPHLPRFSKSQMGAGENWPRRRCFILPLRSVGDVRPRLNKDVLSLTEKTHS